MVSLWIEWEFLNLAILISAVELHEKLVAYMKIISLQISLSWHCFQVWTNNNVTLKDDPYSYAMTFGQKIQFYIS
jgi:hypothetical protein